VIVVAMGGQSIAAVIVGLSETRLDTGWLSEACINVRLSNPLNQSQAAETHLTAFRHSAKAEMCLFLRIHRNVLNPA
jgi:hypothetical protein